MNDVNHFYTISGKAPAAARDKLGPSTEDKRVNAEAEALISSLQSMKH